MKRPLRRKFEERTEKIPEGRLGKLGGGDAIGAVGYVAVESTRPLFELVPGLQQPGYKITSHSTDRSIDGTTHTVTVAAVSKNVAKFAAEYLSAPSNIDYFTSKTEVTDVEVVEEKSTYSIWRITVEVTDPKNG